jgi:hypothetical protein
MVVSYVLVYAVLSLLGRYAPMAEGSFSHYTVSSLWVPYGIIDSHMSADALLAKHGDMWQRPRLARFYMVFFYPLWTIDNQFFHKCHDVYISGDPGADGRWTYTTNTASVLANHR